MYSELWIACGLLPPTGGSTAPSLSHGSDITETIILIRKIHSIWQRANPCVSYARSHQWSNLSYEHDKERTETKASWRNLWFVAKRPDQRCLVLIFAKAVDPQGVWNCPHPSQRTTFWVGQFGNTDCSILSPNWFHNCPENDRLCEMDFPSTSVFSGRLQSIRKYWQRPIADLLWRI